MSVDNTVNLKVERLKNYSISSGFTTKGNGGKDKRGGIDLRPTGCTGAIPNDYMEFMMEHKYGKLQMEYCYRSEADVSQLKTAGRVLNTKHSPPSLEGFTMQ